MQLNADDQQSVRDAAADAWKQSGGKYLRSAKLFQRDPRIAKFDVLTVITLLMYAYKLWQWWNRNKISNPSSVAVYGEPLFGGTQ